ncbi:MAG: glycosyl hydrolase family 18 protein [Planctomycetota bacterium]|nr:glycosyl hydrolase family 18 protein [Planctomycetota bacterium]
MKNGAVAGVRRATMFATLGTTLLGGLAAADVVVTFDVDSAWDGGFGGSILIENTGPDAVEGWELVFSGGAPIDSLWNGAWNQSAGVTTIGDLGWNATIAPGGSVALGYNGSGTFDSDISNLTLNGLPAQIAYGEGAGGGSDGGGSGGGGSDGGGSGGGGSDGGGSDGGGSDGGGSDGGGSGDDGSDDGGSDGGSDDSDGGDAGDGSSPPGCAGDFDGSGVVDGADLGLMLSAWGSAGDASSGDLDGSGVVDGADLGFLLAAWGACPVVEERRVVAYYIEWGTYGRDYQPADIPWESITHLNYAFADIGPDGRVTLFDTFAAIEKTFPGDTWDQPIRGLINQINFVHKPQHPHVRTLISVGGWTLSGRFSDVALTEASREVFAESAVDFIRTYGFDGVDVDWEYPVEGGLASNTYRPEDGVNYTLLLQELRDQLDVAGEEDGRYYELSIAAPAGFDKIRHLECDRLGEILDFINVMTYDLRGAWDLSKAGHHAPLFANPAEPGSPEIREKYTVDWSLQEYLRQGVPASKLVMGVPMYGRGWGGLGTVADGGLFAPASSVPPGTWDDWSSGATGVDDYDAAGTANEGIVQFLAGGDYQRFWDDASKVPYLYSSTRHGGHFISYEDAESMEHKLDYIDEHALGGVMYWEITADRGRELVDLIADRVMSPTGP